MRWLFTATAAFVSLISVEGLAPCGIQLKNGASFIRSSKLSASAVMVTPNGASSASTVDDGAPSIMSIDDIRLNVNEKARTVASVCTSGTLCTTSSAEGIDGAPFGSFVDYILDGDGNPVFLMNDMSMHTVNIRESADGPGGSSMVTLFAQLGQQNSFGQGQDVSRCSVTGTVVMVEDGDEEMDSLRMRYSIAHVYADQVMDSPKFSFYRLMPSKIYFVGGFGVMAKWVEVDEYRVADPDILAEEASDIVARINREHADDLSLTAKHLLGIESEVESVRVTSVDRLGIDIRATRQTGTRRSKLITDEFRIGFRIPVISVEDAKSEVLKVFQEAWEVANGYTWNEDDALPGSNVPVMKIAADSLE